MHRTHPRSADAVDETAIFERLQPVVEHGQPLSVVKSDRDVGEVAQVEQLLCVASDANEVVVGE